MRAQRLRRHLPLDIDLGAVLAVPAVVAATEDQVRFAYTRAWRRTANTLQKRALQQLKTTLAPKKLRDIRRRILTFYSRRNANDLGEMVLWFGLNQMRVRDLRGRLSGPRQHQARDPKTGRFVSARRGRSRRYAEFRSAGRLGTLRFEEGYIAGRGAQRTLYQFDPQTRRAREADAAIYAPALDVIEDTVLDDVAALFFHHFNQDITRRVKYQIHADKRGQRSR